MQIENCKLKNPFEPREKRALSLRAEKIDPKYLSAGKAPAVEAEHKRTDRHAWGKARHYQLRIAAFGGGLRNVRIQLNHGDLKDDEQRLTEIMEDTLAPEPKIAEFEPKVKI